MGVCAVDCRHLRRPASDKPVEGDVPVVYHQRHRPCADQPHDEADDDARVAIATRLGLCVGSVGIWLAVEGYGAWAIVWQTIVLATVKSVFLWTTTGWLPRTGFSMASLRSVFSVGSGVMVCSFLNTLSLNAYSFIIGAYYNLAKLGCYTQADKWSKMGIQSIAQILTASFLPVLSGFQDDRERLLRAMRKMNRFTAYLVFPLLLLLTTCAEPIFHILFGTKWDEAIILFQILAVRGIFIVLATNINNYILGLGRRARLWSTNRSKTH